MNLVLDVVQHFTDNVLSHYDNYEINAFKQFRGVAEPGVARNKVTSYKTDYKSNRGHKECLDYRVTC